jgi:hypothetical protein
VQQTSYSRTFNQTIPVFPSTIILGTITLNVVSPQKVIVFWSIQLVGMGPSDTLIGYQIDGGPLFVQGELYVINTDGAFTETMVASNISQFLGLSTGTHTISLVARVNLPGLPIGAQYAVMFGQVLSG